MDHDLNLHIHAPRGGRVQCHCGLSPITVLTWGVGGRGLRSLGAMRGAPRRLRQLVAHVAPAAGKGASAPSPWASDASAPRAAAHAPKERVLPKKNGSLPSIAELNKDDVGPTDYEEYLFDLKGYLQLKGAVSPEHVAEINAALDAMPLDTMRPGDWWGHVHGHSYGVPGGAGWDDGLNLQQI
eukprot:COSAG04_NODE_2610_length_3859_cov_11.192553_4_plen_183_part_00